MTIDAFTLRHRQAGAVPMRAKPHDRAQERSQDILLVIVPGVSFLSLGCLLEPIRFLQGISPAGALGCRVYDLEPMAADSSGLWLAGALPVTALETRLTDFPKPLAVFFCCGFDVPNAARDMLRRMMRLVRRAQIPIYGIGAATWALAELRLLPNRTGVVHWASLSAFKERNLGVDALPKLYHLDPGVSTCAGEVATLDLFIHFAAAQFGHAVADQISDRFLVSRPRGPEADQPQQAASLLRHAPPLVQSVAARMSQNLENPIRIDRLAQDAGVSQRQLERVFLRYLNASPRKFYLDLQLGLAWQLCEQTNMPLREVALATGFVSTPE